MYKIQDKTYPCSTSLTMKFIGGKWKTVILVHLTEGSKRYNELRKMIPTVTERTLSLQLKQLEEDGLISRRVFTKKPPLKVEYSLTELGKSLSNVLDEIAKWGIQTANNLDNIELIPNVDQPCKYESDSEKLFDKQTDSH